VSEPERLDLLIFAQGDAPTVEMVPASRWRDWMNATEDRLANRCLPLLMANQSGWVLLNPVAFSASWDGGDSALSLKIEYPAGTPDDAQVAQSHFGYGIVTFRFRDLIQTPPGWNLVARGPTNAPKDGIAPLDGVIEADWSAAPFTMNWKLTRPGTIGFEAGEPFCLLFPQRRGELERFTPRIRRLDAIPELARRARAWSAARAMVMIGKSSAQSAGDERWRRYWMEDYFKGKAPTGEASDEHQTVLRLAEPSDET
jgi:hypothetical protein